MVNHRCRSLLQHATIYRQCSALCSCLANVAAWRLWLLDAYATQACDLPCLYEIFFVVVHILRIDTALYVYYSIDTASTLEMIHTQHRQLVYHAYYRARYTLYENCYWRSTFPVGYIIISETDYFLRSWILFSDIQMYKPKTLSISQIIYKANFRYLIGYRFG